MGRYYAQIQGEDARRLRRDRGSLQAAGPERPQSPTDPVAIAVALADKLDTLVGFWAIDEKPTGSKDPYALRRAALGVIRLVLENGIRLSLNACFKIAQGPIATGQLKVPGYDIMKKPFEASEKLTEQKEDLLSFFHDRLKVYLRDKGARHDLIDAALGAGESNDDLLLIVRRVEALGKFLETDDGKNLLAGYKRAANIVRAEEKKDKDASAYNEQYVPGTGAPDGETQLAAIIASASSQAHDAIGKEDFEAAMTALSQLRAPVDRFFEEVTVNDADPAMRLNRLRLLNALRGAVHTVADFSKISG